MWGKKIFLFPNFFNPNKSWLRKKFLVEKKFDYKNVGKSKILGKNRFESDEIFWLRKKSLKKIPQNRICPGPCAKREGGTLLEGVDRNWVDG